MHQLEDMSTGGQTSGDDDATREQKAVATSAGGDTGVVPPGGDDLFEEALSLIGIGRFHIILLALCALANASDAIEILCVSFVLPVAQCDLSMSTADKGFLSSMTFLGMMFGGYIWGTLGDLSGRKYVLISALLFNGIFAVLAGMAQTFDLLLFFRFLSGLGVGGSVPIVWSYFIEFIPKHVRGKMMCCLACSWLIGNLLVVGFAYATLNRPEIAWTFFRGLVRINDWRLFIIVCALPSILTAVLLLFLPESPKFCLYNGRGAETRKILRHIYTFNHGRMRSVAELDAKKRAFELFDRLPRFMRKKTMSDDDDDNINNAGTDTSTPSDLDRAGLIEPNARRTWLAAAKANIVDMVKKTLEMFKRQHLLKTLLIMFISFALSLGYYGLWIWLPELYHRININHGSPCHAIGDSANATTPTNETLNCKLDDDVFFNSFISALSNVPGNLFTIFFIDKMGRNLITSVSFLASGVSVALFPFITSQNEGVVLATIFGGINVITFNSFGCTTTELYPTRIRATSSGLFYVAGRLGAVLGNLLFGLAVDTSCYIPLFTITSLLLLSGLVSLKLPESNKINMQ